MEWPFLRDVVVLLHPVDARIRCAQAERLLVRQPRSLAPPDLLLDQRVPQVVVFERTGERVDVGLPRQIEDDLPQFGREWRQSIAGLGIRYRDWVRLHRILGRRHLGLAVRLFRKGPATPKLPNRIGLRPT